MQAQFDYVTDKDTISVTGYSGSESDVAIPSTINGLPVTSIWRWAFVNRASLRSVTIPDSVTSVVVKAFSGCTSLTAITVDPLNSFLSSVDGVLFDKSQNTLIECPVGKAGSYIVPNSVTSIIDEAFADCINLNTITIPNSVTSIEAHAFARCSSLTAITVDPLNLFYSSMDGVLFDKSQTRLIECPRGKAGSYIVPNGVTSIGRAAFKSCTSLASIAIANSVITIEDEAFASCTSLTKVLIPASVTSIGKRAFAACTSLTNVMIPNSVISIGDWAFLECTRLTSIAIANSVISIGDGAFHDCTSLTKVTIPNSIISIGDGVFSSCTSLTKLTIPNSVTSIGVNAFFSCTSLTNVTIPNSITSIGDGAFYYCTSLTTSRSLTASPASGTGVLFLHQPNQRHVPNSVTSIENEHSIAALTYRHHGGSPNRVYSSMEGVLFDKSRPCSSDVLAAKPEVTSSPTALPASGTGVLFLHQPDQSHDPQQRHQHRGAGVLSCTSLTTITVDPLNSFYSSVDGVLFDKSQTTLIQCPGGKAGSYTVPNSVTNIGGYAFESCHNLTRLTIPKSVSSIGDGAFADCTNLRRFCFEGNAPKSVSSDFYIVTNATVYHLPGTKGWHGTFGGRPTKVWKR